MNYKLLIIVIALGLMSCEKVFFEEEVSSPVEIFELLWNDIDQTYPYFTHKKINWQLQHLIYRPMIDEESTDEELFSVLSQLTLTLRDGHVTLYAPYGVSEYRDWFHAPTTNWVGIEKMAPYFEYLKKANNSIFYGKVKNKNIGYLWVKKYSGPETDFVIIDQIIEELKSTQGIILDLRENGGGLDSNSETIASRFADQKRLYRRYRYRDGANHNDFSDWKETYIEPAGNSYLKPTVVLTNQRCFSAAENCILALQQFPQVTLMGDTTMGGSGSPVVRELPNGWIYRLSTWEEVSPDYRRIEGNGIPPDIAVWLTREEANNDIDKILETAIDFLNEKKNK